MLKLCDDSFCQENVIIVGAAQTFWTGPVLVFFWIVGSLMASVGLWTLAGMSVLLSRSLQLPWEGRRGGGGGFHRGTRSSHEIRSTKLLLLTQLNSSASFPLPLLLLSVAVALLPASASAVPCPAAPIAVNPANVFQVGTTK